MKEPAPIASLVERLTASWRERAVALKALSFALVGLVNTAIDATIFFLLLAYVTPSLVVANVTAWFIANTGSYVMNSFTTFSAETGGRLSVRHYAGFVGSGIWRSASAARGESRRKSPASSGILWRAPQFRSA